MTWQKGQSGNPNGRPKGSRNKLSQAVLEAWCADFMEYGPGVIEKLRTSDPSTYARVAVSLVPKDIEVTTTQEPEYMSDAELLAIARRQDKAANS